MGNGEIGRYGSRPVEIATVKKERKMKNSGDSGETV